MFYKIKKSKGGKPTLKVGQKTPPYLKKKKKKKKNVSKTFSSGTLDTSPLLPSLQTFFSLLLHCFGHIWLKIKSVAS